ncbi:hypothetical protein TRVA0_052S00672 [Trichomonascus vanleenenianus]|uniref:Put7p n=1 Tax=Trichomonascus vanleenenianus TaxID=2268995 RepID=UPI003EC978F0
MLRARFATRSLASKRWFSSTRPWLNDKEAPAEEKAEPPAVINEPVQGQPEPETPETKEFKLAKENMERYFHYFDTQKIYSGFKYSGFTDGQADVLMLTIRDMLSRKLAKCKEEHPQQSQAENDAYLFDAACSEIRNEIQTSRQAQNEEYRSYLARIQRDYEILHQEMNEMISTMKSEIEMEINERKNTTRAEESIVDLKIQELNNKITIDIISDIKSKIEALRWQTTRRGLIAVLLVMSGILLGTSAVRKEEKSVKKREPAATGEEFQVPVLTVSEMDDSIEDRPVESLNGLQNTSSAIARP